MTKFIKANEVITAIESLKKEFREEATRKKEYISKVAYIYGEDAIRLFNDRYTNDTCFNYAIIRADERVRNIKIQGSSKFVYIAVIELSFDYLQGKAHISITHLEKCVEYNGEILSFVGFNNDKTFELCLYNEYISTSKRLCQAPQKVGTITDKKMQAWLDYLQAEKASQAGAKNAKIQAFKKELCELANISEEDFQGRTHGTKYGKFFDVEWRISGDTGHCGIVIKVSIEKAYDKEFLRTLKEKGLLD